MTEAHYLLLVCERVLDPCLDRCDAADLEQVFDHALVGAAVKRTLQCADRRYDRRIHVGQCRGCHARRKRRSIQLVVGMKDERYIHRSRSNFVGLFPVERVQKVPGQRQLLVWVHGLQPFAHPLKRRDDYRELCRKPYGFAGVCFERIVRTVGVVKA